jgi:hypothetical protein
MSEEKTESRINIEDLPQPERELSPEEAKEVQGGFLVNVEALPTKQPKKEPSQTITDLTPKP